MRAEQAIVEPPTGEVVMTLRDVAVAFSGRTAVRDVTFDVAASLSGTTVTGTATTTIKMSDFGVGPITLAGMLQTQDDVKLSMQFVARPG